MTAVDGVGAFGWAGFSLHMHSHALFSTFFIYVTLLSWFGVSLRADSMFVCFCLQFGDSKFKRTIFLSSVL